MNVIRLAFFSLAVAAGGWLLVIPRLHTIGVFTKLGYMVYCPVIAVAVALFLLVAMCIRHRMSGSSYALFGIAWALFGWVVIYFSSIALTSGIIVVASGNAHLSFIPVGLPVTNMCAVSAAIGSLAQGTMLAADVTHLLRRRGRRVEDGS